MANVFQNAPIPSNPTTQPDTRNLGFQFAGQSNPWSGPQVTNPNYGVTGNFGSPAGGNQNGFNINSIIQKQLGSNAQARQQNQANWTGASSYLKNFATPYDQATIDKMKASNAMTAQGGANNAFREQQGIMAASGQGDASSLAAAAAEADRNALGARVGADNQLDMQTHLANNQAGFNVGNSILSNLPQYKPDDYSGLGMLGLMGQNQSFQQGLLQNQMDRPISPGMTNSRPAFGNGIFSQSGQGGGIMGGAPGYNPNGGGGNGYASYNPAGVQNQLNGWGNGQANGNDLTKMYGAPSGSPYAGNYQPQGDPSWWNTPAGAGGAQYNFTNGMGR